MSHISYMDHIIRRSYLFLFAIQSFHQSSIVERVIISVLDLLSFNKSQIISRKEGEDRWGI